MLTCCNTTRGRVVCGLGGVLIAALALVCLWAFSPAVTAGDPPVKKKKGDCPDPALPQTTAKDKTGIDVPDLPPTPALPKPPKPDDSTGLPAIPGADVEKSLPPHSDPLVSGTSPTKAPPPSVPVADTPPPPIGTVPPPPDLPPMTGTAKPPPPPVKTEVPSIPLEPVRPVAGTAPVPPPVQQAQPPVDAQDIKQLVAQLTAIRAERTKLDEHEKQTIQGIKKKYQEQKRALEQLDRELRQLGINCDETSPEKAPSRPTGADVPW